MTKFCLRFSKLELKYGSFLLPVTQSIYKIMVWLNQVKISDNMKERMRRHEYRAKITGGSEKANHQEAFCANSVLTSSAYGVRSFSSPASSRISCSSSKPSCPNTRFSFQVS